MLFRPTEEDILRPQCFEDGKPDPEPIDAEPEAPDMGVSGNIPNDAPREKATPQNLAAAFALKADGVYCLSGDEPKLVCSPVRILSRTRNKDGENWGRLLETVDMEGRVHEFPIAMELFAGDGGQVIGYLLNRGVTITPGRTAKQRLLEYIQRQPTSEYALCVEKVGWHDGTFILPNQTFGSNGAERVLFQSPTAVEHYFKTAGTLPQWREHVSLPCAGNSRLVFGISVSLAAPLLHVVDMESGGFHIMGSSSLGKTTFQWVAGSVCGGGGVKGFLRSWRATANGLEAVAELHNDGILLLDEMGQVDAREVGQIAYMLANGQGKSRMGSGLTMQRTITWRILFISTGELSLRQVILSSGGLVKGGQEVRVAEIQADAGAGLGLFEDIHGAETPRAFADTLMKASGEYYGTALPMFLTHVTGNYASTKEKIQSYMASFGQEYLPSKASSEVGRVLHRFALAAAAGELATELGITGWQKGEARHAAAKCFNSWLQGRGSAETASDAEQGVRRVRAFIEAHGASRFQRVDDDGDGKNVVVYNRAGYVTQVDDPLSGESKTEYLFLPTCFKDEVCIGLNSTLVAKALDAKGYLRREDAKHPSVRFNGQRVYAVNGSILESE